MKKLFLTVTLLLGLLPTAVESQEFPYTVELEYPNNQVDIVKGYFLLRVSPGMKQTLTMKITNGLEKEQTFRIEATDAYTNSTGGMLYERNLEYTETKLLENAIKLSEFLKTPDRLTVGPRETKSFSIEVTAPNITEGTVLGGIRVIGAVDKEEVGKSTKGEAKFILQTESATATAIQLNYDKKLPANFQIGDAGFRTDTGELYITFRNDVRMIQDYVSGTYQVENEQGEQLFKGEFNPFKMAPDTEIQYPILWQGDTLEPGEYTLTLALKANQKTINESRQFSIEETSVQEFVEKNPEKTTTVQAGMPSWVWIVISVATFIIVLLIILLIKMRKRS